MITVPIFLLEKYGRFISGAPKNQVTATGGKSPGVETGRRRGGDRGHQPSPRTISTYVSSFVQKSKEKIRRLKKGFRSEHNKKRKQAGQENKESFRKQPACREIKYGGGHEAVARKPAEMEENNPPRRLKT